MADTKMTILSLIWTLSAKFHVFQKYTFREHIIDALIPQKRMLTPSGTVFSKFTALEPLSERLRNKWCHNDVISRHSDIKVSVVVRISAYLILCKLGGHSITGYIGGEACQMFSNYVNCKFFLQAHIFKSGGTCDHVNACTCRKRCLT